MSARWSLPPEFDPGAYREANAYLADLEDNELVAHYNAEGKRLGLRCNALRDRWDFAALVPAEASALEIGPFASPVLDGPNVRYADVLDTQQLRERAPREGMDAARVPDIHFVMHGASLDGIPDRFDVLLSSHCIEHQPDLIGHLQQVERRLNPGGRYFVLVPDKRFCFDRNLAASTVAEVLQAHQERRQVHTLRSVIEHRAFMTHNDASRHWAEAAAAPEDGRGVAAEKVAAAMREYEAAAGGYIDVHAWYFTPDSFRQLLRLLGELDLTRLRVERLYRTRRDRLEFWAVLALDPQPPGPFDPATAGPEAAGAAPSPPPSAGPPARGGLLGRTLQALSRGRAR
ncbi:MAG TPA: methyltransferase domain-containing protein [Ramlibacter sp.]|nr:methyltransferase domain-containing protein [Ramlibacter sp.]